MDEDIIRQKIEKTIDLVCKLYKHNIITDAIITGSVAKGTARKESDIDIYIINLSFTETADIPPETFIYQFLKKEEIKKFRSDIELAKTLKDIGVEFKQIERKGEVFWYQLYKGELFHLMTRKMINPFMEGMKVTKDLCPDQN